MADENVLFKSSGSEEDVWDDTVLIKAYDKAVNLAKETAAKRMGIKPQNPVTKHTGKQKSQTNKTPKNTNKVWVTGSPCRAVYSEDQEVYEAIITNIHDDHKTCTIKFIGYGNTQTVELDSLLESEGLESQILQQKEALAGASNQNGTESASNYPYHSKDTNGTCGEKMDCDTEDSKVFKNIFSNPTQSVSPMLGLMPPPPPMPPQMMARLPENDADALSSMLMSWYISGFHTGYYHGLKQAKNKEKMSKQ
ncbi:survival motor neuron protein 1 isoform X2 [Orussus abietinus]|uniref:survival motor neuron protein 1 isoform X2 n=1 Tax=Orussus abietinus TaxID=222816 RepID=UPI000626A5DE|nr:survival motor neuron protein 1 isoform X2 [Orussus abietinus]